MNYKSDNLSPTQKKNALIGIFFLSTLFVAFFIYKNKKRVEREELLNNNTETTICKIIQTSTYKGVTSKVEYKVSGKRYTYQGLSYKGIQIGELYNLKYSTIKPSISKVIYSKPVINNIKDFKESKGKVTSIYSNTKINIVKIQYDYEEKKYERNIYVDDITIFKENLEYNILVNKKKPKISYLKSIVKILN